VYCDDAEIESGSGEKRPIYLLTTRRETNYDVGEGSAPDLFGITHEKARQLHGKKVIKTLDAWLGNPSGA
jgi:hypothetical protein